MNSDYTAYEGMTQGEQAALLNKVGANFCDLGLSDLGNPSVLMVSGGSDSVALLLMTLVLSRNAQGSTKDLLVLHVNHQLRGAEAEADEDFVVKLCKKLNVACKVEHASVADFAKETGASIEQAGRTLRYELAEKALLGLGDGVADKRGPLPVRGTENLPVRGTENLPVRGTENLPVRGTENLPVRGTENLPVRG
ncbi:MAG: hypothetical protein LBP91_02525, partial [Coriobacteriales bacterium]|nr:hypothetical protein [Coriobacteriales bacterium]